MAIRSTGFFNNKAKSLIGAASKILADFGGQVPKTMDEMLTIPGAARKTANVVLGGCYNIHAGIVVDTHVQRNALRLDLTKNTNPVKIEQDLMKIIPKREMVRIPAAADLPRPRAVRRAQTQMRRVQTGSVVLREGQNRVTLAFYKFRFKYEQM